MDNVIKKVRDFICSNNLISSGDIVGCGLSGGADSIFMTYVLNEISKYMNFRVIGIHVNHLLRGDDSYDDEKFSYDFCKKYNIEFKSVRYDVLKYSKDNKVSIEMGGREVRYSVFEDLRKNGVITKCALAHHADDDVETIIMRIFRGTGIEGIEGIKLIREDFYIRPVLFLRRVYDIEKYLNDNNIPFIIDKSNLSEDYLRNRIRLSIIPKINESFSMDVCNNILSLKEICKYDNEFFDYILKDYSNKYVDILCDKVVLDKEAFNLHRAILYRIIRFCIFKLVGDISNINLKHIKIIEGIIHKDKNKTFQIKNNLYVINREKNIEFSLVNNINEDMVLYEEVLNKQEITLLKFGEVFTYDKYFNFGDSKLSIKIEKVRNNDLNLNNKYEKYFCIDNLQDKIVIRNRRNGDRFKPFGMKNTKKLKDFLINEKVSNKNCIPLLCFDDDIAWVVGIRNSEDYKVLSNSICIVRIKISLLGDRNYDE